MDSVLVVDLLFVAVDVSDCLRVEALPSADSSSALESVLESELAVGVVVWVYSVAYDRLSVLVVSVVASVDCAELDVDVESVDFLAASDD